MGPIVRYRGGGGGQGGGGSGEGGSPLRLIQDWQTATHSRRVRGEKLEGTTGVNTYCIYIPQYTTPCPCYIPGHPQDSTPLHSTLWPTGGPSYMDLLLDR